MAWRVIGQDTVLHPLQQAVANKRVAHAYLIVGPSQVGKATLAYDLACAVNCTESKSPPCGVCNPCQRILSNKHADIHRLALQETSPEHPSIEIRVEQIREIQPLTNLPPYEGKYRICVIFGADLLSEEAGNALLKNLEEPLPALIFLLLSNRPNDVLATIRSRCQRLDLRLVPRSRIVDLLHQEYALDKSQADELAWLSGGHVGWAIQAALDSKVAEQKNEAIDLAIRMEHAPLEERFAQAASLATNFFSNRSIVWNILDSWEQWWRDTLLTCYQLGENIPNKEQQIAARNLSGQLGYRGILSRLESLRETRESLESNANPRLALEVLMLRLGAKEKSQLG